MKKVMASGTFDLLHPGHGIYLQEAKNLGGYNSKLFVVVARDSTVEKRKRVPIVGENQRLELIKMLKHILDHSDEIDVLALSNSVVWMNSNFANNNFIEVRDLSRRLIYDTNITYFASSSNGSNANSDMTKQINAAHYPMTLEGAICCGSSSSNNKIMSTCTPCKSLQITFYGEKVTQELSNPSSKAVNGCSPANYLLAGCGALLTVLLTKKLGRKPTREEKEKCLLERTIPYPNLNMRQAGNGLFNFMAYNDNVQKPDGYAIYLEGVDVDE